MAEGQNPIVENFLGGQDFTIADKASEFQKEGALDFEADNTEEETTEAESKTETEVEASAEEATEETEEESTEETESSLTEENTEEKSSEETTENQETETPLNIDDEISQRTEGKFKSYDELHSAYKEAIVQTPKEPEFANEQIKQLNELVKQGVELTPEYFQAQAMDYTKYDIDNVSQAKELIAMELKLNEPGITDREIELTLSDKYKLNEDEFDEKEIELSTLRLMREGRNAQKNLIENQKKYALPTNQADPVELERQQKEAEAAQAKFTSSVKEAVSKYEGESFKIGDETFKYEADDKAKTRLEYSMNNTDKYFNKYVDKDGNIDFESLRRDQFRLENFDKIIQSAISQAQSTGSKKVASKLKNNTLGTKKKVTTATAPKSVMGQVVQQVFGQ